LSSEPKLKISCRMDTEAFKKVYPVVAVENHGNGVFRVKRESKIQGHFDHRNGRKGRKIKMLSSKSLQQLTATVQATDVEFLTMLTLTYPKIFPPSGAIVKKDLNGILTNLRSKGSFEYLWFLEFQTRGAPHIHLLTSHDCITPRMRINLAEWWTSRIINAEWFQRLVVLESVKCDRCEYDTMAREVRKVFAVALHRDTWQLVRERDGAKRYVTKYASKPEQKIVPAQFRDVGRFWGASRNVALGYGKRIATSEDEFKDFLDDQEHPAASFETLPTWVWGVENT
jgi:hypothetical protein